MRTVARYRLAGRAGRGCCRRRRRDGFGNNIGGGAIGWLGMGVGVADSEGGTGVEPGMMGGVIEGGGKGGVTPGGGNGGITPGGKVSGSLAGEAYEYVSTQITSEIEDKGNIPRPGSGGGNGGAPGKVPGGGIIGIRGTRQCVFNVGKTG